jgi:hypothetical protein
LGIAARNSKLRQAAVKMKSANNVKQIGVAIQNFAGTYPSQLPDVDGQPHPASVDENGMVVSLSWMVSAHVVLLPDIEGPSGSRVFENWLLNWNQTQATGPILAYLSPADPSIATKPPGYSYIATSYIFNAKVFGK